jgi:hypothetical protein
MILTTDKNLHKIFLEIYQENPRNVLAEILFNLKNLVGFDSMTEEIILSRGSDNGTINVKTIPSDEFVEKKKAERYDLYTGYQPTKERLSKREELRLGRFINRFIEGNFKDTEIEEYINLYRAKYDEVVNESEFRIVDGNDIVFWYNCDNYEKGGGTLNNSCMRTSGEGRLNAYSNNPDKVKMLILVNGRNKLMGRCILWKLDYPKGKIYADRIYTTKDSDKKRFNSYIRKKGWLHYSSDSSKKMVVVLNNYASGYPYFDTFRIYKAANKYQEYYGKKSEVYIKEMEKTYLTSRDFDPKPYIGKTSKGIFSRLFKQKEQTFERMMTFEQFKFYQEKRV